MGNLRKNSFKFIFAIFVSIFVFANEPLEAADDVVPDVALGLDTNTEIPVAQMGPWVNKQFELSNTISLFVQGMLDRSRKENDTVKILCLDDKLTQIHALLHGIEIRIESFANARNANDVSGAKHQFVILQVSFNKLNGLRVQADACVGSADIITGPSDNEIQVSEDITKEEATTPDQEIFTPEPVIRPTVASGFR